MLFGHAIWPGGTAGSPQSSAASCRTVARSLTVNPAGSTSRTRWLGGRVDSMNVIRVSLGTARHSAVSLADPAPIITPPGFTLGDGWAAAPAAGAREAGPDAAVPVPATVVPQAASPIMSPAVMPPSAARLAAPSGLPSVLIATPFGRGAIRAAPRCFARPPTGRDPRGRPGRPGPAPRSRGGPGQGAPAPAVLVGAGRPGCPKPTRTQLDGPRHRLVPLCRAPFR